MAMWRRQAKPRPASSDATPITITGDTWQEQFTALWDQLVPASGAAPTEQGEAIRIVGKLSREILDNGSINWNADFQAMVDQLVAYMSSRTAVAGRRELERLRTIVRSGAGSKSELYRLTELAVAWVRANPYLAPLGQTSYRN